MKWNTRNYLPFVILLFFANLILFQFGVREVHVDYSESTILKYGELIPKSVRNLSSSKSRINMFILIHPDRSYKQIFAWANVAQEILGKQFEIVFLTYDQYQYADILPDNKVRIIVDKKRNYLKKLGNIGTEKLKVIISIQDTVIYCRKSVPSLLEEAGGILLEKVKRIDLKGRKFTAMSIQTRCKEEFKSAENKFKYFVFYKSLCRHCGLDAELNKVKSNENCALILSPYHFENDIDSTIKTLHLNPNQVFISDPNCLHYFNLAQEPSIYKKRCNMLVPISKEQFFSELNEGRNDEESDLLFYSPNGHELRESESGIHR